MLFVLITLIFFRHQADPKATIKEYSRPAAGKEEAKPADLRPAEVLITTVEYMVNRYVHTSSEYYSASQNFKVPFCNFNMIF